MIEHVYSRLSYPIQQQEHRRLAPYTSYFKVNMNKQWGNISDSRILSVHQPCLSFNDQKWATLLLTFYRRKIRKCYVENRTKDRLISVTKPYAAKKKQKKTDSIFYCFCLRSLWDNVRHLTKLDAHKSTEKCNCSSFFSVHGRAFGITTTFRQLRVAAVSDRARQSEITLQSDMFGGRRQGLCHSCSIVPGKKRAVCFRRIYTY